MPAAPPARTLRPLSMRPLTPRWQTTILPVAAPGSEVRLAERVLEPAAGLRQRRRQHDRGRRGDAVGQRDARTCRTSRRRRRSGAAWSVNAARAGRGADRRHPRAAVVGGRRARAAVAGRGVDRDPGVRSRRGTQARPRSVYGCAPPEIEKLITLTPSAIACCTARHRVGAEAALREADAVLDHARARGDTADRAALDAVEHCRGDAVAGGRRRRVRAVTLGVARRALPASRCCRTRRPSGARVRHVRGGLGVRADQLVVAGERRAEMGDVRAVAELAAP